MKQLIWLGLIFTFSCLTSATLASEHPRLVDSNLVQPHEPKQHKLQNNEPGMVYGGYFSQGLAPVRIGEKYGFIDKSGKIIIQAKFDRADEFHEGLALVGIGGTGKGERKLGFIDHIGRVVIPLKFNTANAFSDGFAQVQISEDYKRTSYINKSGKVMLELTDVMPEDFSEGFAQVCDPPKRPKGFCSWRNIDKFGNTLKFPNIQYFGQFSEGLAPARGDKANLGYIDKTGQFVISPQFDMGSPFHDGLAKVQVSTTSRTSQSGRSETEWGYIDKSGQFAVKPQFFEEAANFSDGLARVRINKRWGYIDKTGQFVIPPIFDQATDFSEGLAFVLQEPDCPGNTVDYTNNKEGFIDRTGKVILRVKYDRENDMRWGWGCNPDFTLPPLPLEPPVTQSVGDIPAQARIRGFVVGSSQPPTKQPTP
jgi:hypothetical protein